MTGSFCRRSDTEIFAGLNLFKLISLFSAMTLFANLTFIRGKTLKSSLTNLKTKYHCPINYQSLHFLLTPFYVNVEPPAVSQRRRLCYVFSGPIFFSTFHSLQFYRSSCRRNLLRPSGKTFRVRIPSSSVARSSDSRRIFFRGLRTFLSSKKQRR